MKATLEDFSQSNFLGAIPMGFDTIIVGLISYYNYRPEAVWVAYVFFWISTAMTMCVSLGAVFVMFTHQDNHKLEAVTGVWVSPCPETTRPFWANWHLAGSFPLSL